MLVLWNSAFGFVESASTGQLDFNIVGFFVIDFHTTVLRQEINILHKDGGDKILILQK